MNHIKLWWQWQKLNRNSTLYKTMVLLQIIKSPTMERMRWNNEFDEEMKTTDKMR